MMKRAIPLLTFLAISFADGPVVAQVFYAFPDAPVTAQRRVVSGTYVSVGDHDLLRLGGYGRIGVAQFFDAGLELLIDTADGTTRGGIGGDVKLTVFPENKAIPFDLSLNAAFGYISGGDFSAVQAPLGGIISSPFELESGSVLVPYLGVYLLIIDERFERANAPTITDTDVDAELRGGLRYSIDEGMDVFGTVHLGRDALLTFGANFRL